MPLETPPATLDFTHTSTSTTSSLSPSEHSYSQHVSGTEDPSSAPLSLLLDAALSSFTRQNPVSYSSTDSSTASLDMAGGNDFATRPFAYPSTAAPEESEQNHFLSSLFRPSQAGSSSPSFTLISSTLSQPSMSSSSTTDPSYSYMPTASSAAGFSLIPPFSPTATNTVANEVSPSNTISTSPVPCQWDDCGETFPTLEQLIDHFRSTSSHDPLVQSSTSFPSAAQSMQGQQSNLNLHDTEEHPVLQCHWGGEQHALDWTMSEASLGEGRGLMPKAQRQLQCGTGMSPTQNGVLPGHGLTPQDLLLKHLLEDHLGRLNQQQQANQQQQQQLIQQHTAHLSQPPLSASSSSASALPSASPAANVDPNLIHLHHQQFHQQSTLYPIHDPSTCTFDFSNYSVVFSDESSVAPSPPQELNQPVIQPTHHHHYGTIHHADHDHDHAHHTCSSSSTYHSHTHHHPIPSSTRTHQRTSSSSASSSSSSLSTPILKKPSSKPKAQHHLKPSSRASFAPPLVDTDASLSITNMTSAPSSSPTEIHACGYPNCDETFPNTDALTKHLDAVHVGSGKETYACGWEGCERGINGREWRLFR